MVAVFQPVFVFQRRRRTQRRRRRSRKKSADWDCESYIYNKEKKNLKEVKEGKKPGGTQGSNG